MKSLSLVIVCLLSVIAHAQDDWTLGENFPATTDVYANAYGFYTPGGVQDQVVDNTNFATAISGQLSGGQWGHFSSAKSHAWSSISSLNNVYRQFSSVVLETAVAAHQANVAALASVRGRDNGGKVMYADRSGTANWDLRLTSSQVGPDPTSLSSYSVSASFGSSWATAVYDPTTNKWSITGSTVEVVEGDNVTTPITETVVGLGSLNKTYVCDQLVVEDDALLIYASVNKEPGVNGTMGNRGTGTFTSSKLTLEGSVELEQAIQ